MEDLNDFAWAQLFSNGKQGLLYRNKVYRVRAIRAF